MVGRKVGGCVGGCVGGAVDVEMTEYGVLDDAGSREVSLPRTDAEKPAVSADPRRAAMVAGECLRENGRVPRVPRARVYVWAYLGLSEIIQGRLDGPDHRRALFTTLAVPTLRSRARGVCVPKRCPKER